MKAYCEGIGLTLLHFTRRGHAVYGDPASHHTFTDSAPHAQHISEDHYANARRTADKIREARPLVEAPIQYEETYTFYGVHNVCAREGRTCHEVYVPGVDSATGAGETMEVALHVAREMLTHILQVLQTQGAPIPVTMAPKDVEAHARERRATAGFTVTFCDVVPVTSFSAPTELSEPEQAALQRDIQAIWDDDQVAATT